MNFKYACSTFSYPKVELLTILVNSYTGYSIDADVAYDIFTASTPDGNAEYEVMIWV